MANRADSRPRIIAVILAYNCARMLSRAYEKIPKDIVDDIILMDDHSTDKTFEKAKELKIKAFRNEKNYGYGGNLKRGLQKAWEMKADYVVEIHGDGAQFNPVALYDTLDLMKKGNEFIVGSRFQEPLTALKNGMPLIRFAANIFLSFFDKLVLRLPFTEFHTGFRVYSRKLFEKVPTEGTSDDYLYSFQIIAQAAYYRIPCGEVPVEADYKSEHTSHALTGATVYALQTFGILGLFVLARLGVFHSKLFPKIYDSIA